MRQERRVRRALHLRITRARNRGGEPRAGGSRRQRVALPCDDERRSRRSADRTVRVTVDVTAVLAENGPQVLVVRAEDDPQDLEQPRGKQDWEERPHAVWYERTSGIWQPVWLEPVPATRVDSLRWTPDLDEAVLRLDVRLTRVDDRPLRLNVVLTQDGEVFADDVVTVRGRRVLRDFPFAETDTTLGRHTTLWSPENPNLIDAAVRLLDADGDVVDEVGSYTALRSIAANIRIFSPDAAFSCGSTKVGWLRRAAMAKLSLCTRASVELGLATTFGHFSTFSKACPTLRQQTVPGSEC